MKSKAFSWVNNSLYEDISSNGVGTFTRDKIAKGTLLIVFGGYINTLQEEELLPESVQDIAIQVEKNLVIGPILSVQRQNGDYVNHSCNPNSGIRGQISLFAICDIKPKEEILFDYGTVLYGEGKRSRYQMKCNCGSTDCRKIVTDDDWKSPILQKKLKGFFPYYIQEKIDLSRD